MSTPDEIHGGILVGEVLAKQGVRFLYTLCGGHISPILVGAAAQGIRVIDVRHEATSVFAADATARLTGVPGVAAVTAGPGITNTITALKNAQMAQSPVVLLGGAAATLLKGRGALQDIDQIALVTSIVKWSASAKRVRDIVPLLEKAFQQAQEGVPGPVFLELPVDLLYQQSVVAAWTGQSAGKGLAGKATGWYLARHVRRTFASAWDKRASDVAISDAENIPQTAAGSQRQRVLENLKKAKRPLLVIGSQALLDAEKAMELQQAVLKMGIPTYLSGMARGLLGRNRLHMRHKRSKALREADLIILAGVPCDFRLGYGRVIPRKATHIAINRSRADLRLNKKPTVGILADPGAFLRALGDEWPKGAASHWSAWVERLIERDNARDAEIVEQARAQTASVNPVRLCRQIDDTLADESVLVGDGGDFVGTASYTVRPRGPLSWLDPGAFGTLGSGAGFALAAKLCRPEAEVWLLYGDGSAGYSLAEFDTFTRHNVPIIAVVGNDAGWTQIARDQVDILGTPLGTELAQTDYHRVAEGYGGVGLCVDDPELLQDALTSAKQTAREGKPVLVNVHLGKSDFRKGSLSM